MFNKKRAKSKKRVVCPIPVILEIIQETIDMDEGLCKFIFRYEGEVHRVGLISDYNWKRGFFDPSCYLDEQEFDDFEIFKLQATLNGKLFTLRTDNIEIIEAGDGATEFPWYTKLEEYVID